jgi:hypothetical protein
MTARCQMPRAPISARALLSIEVPATRWPCALRCIGYAMLYGRPARFLPAASVCWLCSACSTLPTRTTTPSPATSPTTAPLPGVAEPTKTPPDAPSSVLHWSAEGTLDGVAGPCSGTASVTQTATSVVGYAACWGVTHERGDCPAPDIDWLTEGAPLLCRDDSALQLVGNIPGLGRCSVARAEMIGQRLESLVLDCEWECRDQGQNACSGVAFYRYRR